MSADADLDEVLRRHGYQHLVVTQVVTETDDARSFVLEVPEELREAFRYRPGQFCTFRVRLGDDEHARCYSMSSAPSDGDHLTVTVKRVPGGVVSNWLIDHVSAGDQLEVTRPAGTFCVEPGSDPVVGFCGGSGVTPLVSIARSLLAGSARPVRLFYANRDADSVIFDGLLAELADRHPDQFELRSHLDSQGGFVEPGDIAAFVGDRRQAQFYLCGPGAFMDLVEQTLLDLGVDPDRIFIERFVVPTAPTTNSTSDSTSDRSALEQEAATAPESITLILRGTANEVAYHPGDTVLETARRAGLAAPYSCEAGNSATCMALVRDGTATMRTNQALTSDEVEEGWVLTCQAVPAGPTLTIEYETL